MYEPPEVTEIEHPHMTDFQALVTGSVVGALMKASKPPPEGFLAIEVESVFDGENNYLPEIVVKGKHSGETLRIKVERDE